MYIIIIQDDTLRVLGKGNKVRIVYLNDACKGAKPAIPRNAAGSPSFEELKNIPAVVWTPQITPPECLKRLSV